jgi:hypothetical protein
LSNRLRRRRSTNAKNEFLHAGPVGIADNYVVKFRPLQQVTQNLTYRRRPKLHNYPFIGLIGRAFNLRSRLRVHHSQHIAKSGVVGGDLEPSLGVEDLRSRRRRLLGRKRRGRRGIQSLGG